MQTNKTLMITKKQIKDIVSKYKKTSFAVNELCKILPFNEKICYNIVCGVMNDGNDIQLIDDYSDNKHIDEIVESFTKNEINSLKNTMEEQEKKEEKEKEIALQNLSAIS